MASVLQSTPSISFTPKTCSEEHDLNDEYETPQYCRSALLLQACAKNLLLEVRKSLFDMRQKFELVFSAFLLRDKIGEFEWFGKETTVAVCDVGCSGVFNLNRLINRTKCLSVYQASRLIPSIQ
jgi:hypothetical protein